MLLHQLEILVKAVKCDFLLYYLLQNKQVCYSNFIQPILKLHKLVVANDVPINIQRNHFYGLQSFKKFDFFYQLALGRCAGNCER